MGLDGDEAAAVCLDFDKACAGFDRWRERREGETRLEPYTPDKSKTPKRPVPVYRTVGALLGLDDEPRDRLTPEQSAALDERVEALRHDPAALRAYLLDDDAHGDATDGDETAEMEAAKAPETSEVD